MEAQVTAPEDFLGFKPGADFHLMTYEEAIGYFEHIAQQTDRMLVLDMGETSEGRRMKYGVISSAENLGRLDHFKEINRRISLPHGLSEIEARGLAEEGRTIVWIDGGLHGTEVAPAQLLPKLAYDLVTGNDRQMEAIRENVITLLVFANPDGMTIVSDWYMGNVGTPYEVSPIPWLYHKYVGHDNNRDSFMGNLIETRNMNRAHSLEWFPEILYNQHQTGPFPARIWIPPDAEPTNPNVHPLIVRWKSLIGTVMGKAFEENNQPGAISRIRYDTWYPGYATQVVDGHNVASILTETQLYRYATPQHFTVNDFPEEHRDLTKGVFYPNPWLGGWWRLGDAVTYNSTACKAVLEAAATYRYDLLYDKYKVGIEVMERFTSEPPYGYIVPAEQPDRGSTALLMDRMLVNGIEIQTADEPFMAVAEMAHRIGKEPSLIQQDVPGFVVNRISYAMYREAMNIIDSGIADVETVDRAFRNAQGLWATMCGPLRWMDLSGGPALYANAIEGVLPSLSNTTELSETLKKLRDDDARGIANGHGFYEYTDEEAARWEALIIKHAWNVRKLVDEYFPIEPPCD